MRRLLWPLFIGFTGLWALVILYQPHEARLPSLKRARAIQWVLTAHWLEELFYQRHGEYIACDDRKAWCGERLSWMAYTRRMEGWQFEVTSNGQDFTAWARGPEETWKLERGGVPVRISEGQAPAVRESGPALAP